MPAKPTVVIQARIDPELYEEARRQARVRGLTLSALIVRALEQIADSDLADRVESAR